MKKILLFGITSIILLGLTANAQASILGSEHDMFSRQLGQDPNVCSYCHIPHNAVGDTIWSDWANEAELENGPSSELGNKCYTCHDGTVTNIGQTTVFNTALQQHKVEEGADCNMCHTVHDNTNGKFLGIVKTQSPETESATYCQTCHDATMYEGAEHLGDHLAGSEHPYKDSGAVLDESCNSCHQMHGAVNYTTEKLTNPILKEDNTDTAFCASCHPNFVQDTGENANKHPAILASPGSWGKVDCFSCHDTHQPDATDHPAILLDPNVDSAFCTTCHEASGNAKAPSIGDHTHPTDKEFTTIGLTPSADDIDDNDDSLPDYAHNAGEIACESCHSPHLKGVSAPLVRITKAAGLLCSNCHIDK